MTENARRKTPRKRPRPAMTPARLRNIAIYYCQRYVVSSGKLADYLKRRLRREMEDAAACAEMEGEIPEIVAACARSGLVDDEEAVSARLRGALRAGYAKGAALNLASRAAMVDRDMAAGALDRAVSDVEPEIAEAGLEPAEERAALAEAALRRARRGPYRTGRMDEKTEKRDIDWLRRRGFRFDDIRRAMRLDGDGFDDDDADA
jgi:SOS response regulatory protein OraA/RecX